MCVYSNMDRHVCVKYLLHMHDPNLFSKNKESLNLSFSIPLYGKDANFPNTGYHVKFHTCFYHTDRRYKYVYHNNLFIFHTKNKSFTYREIRNLFLLEFFF